MHNINKIIKKKYQTVSYMIFTSTSTSSMLFQIYTDISNRQYFCLLLCSAGGRLSRNFPSLQARNIIYVEKEIEVRNNFAS
jgi:hypothetical protein